MLVNGAAVHRSVFLQDRDAARRLFHASDSFPGPGQALEFPEFWKALSTAKGIEALQRDSLLKRLLQDVWERSQELSQDLERSRRSERELRDQLEAARADAESLKKRLAEAEITGEGLRKQLAEGESKAEALANEKGALNQEKEKLAGELGRLGGRACGPDQGEQATGGEAQDGPEALARAVCPGPGRRALRANVGRARAGPARLGWKDEPVELEIRDVLDLHSFRPDEVPVRTLAGRDPHLEAYGDAPAEHGAWGATWVRFR